MPSRRHFLLAAMAAGSGSSAFQSTAGEFAVETPHPRLLLPSRRLRLLRREKERDSMRWVQFNAIVKAGPALPEPGFACALYYTISGDAEHGRRAIKWALEQGDDLRQLALVFDWCQDLLSADEKAKLAKLLETAIAKPLDGCKPASTETNGAAPGGNCDLATIRSRALAAVALAQHAEGVTERELQFVVRDWWNGKIIPALKHGESPFSRDETYALMELLHVIRDNVRTDLRDDYKAFFAVQPLHHLLTYYPASYPGPSNELRIPVILNGGEPDLNNAALSRAAELSMVAFDPNALEVQFLQGWCMQDRFLMRDPFGIAYEFLWANPYHPGLSYYNAPLLFHDGDRGLLVVREHWDDGAKWFFHSKGIMQTFGEGSIQPLAWKDVHEPLVFGGSTVWPLKNASRFRIATEEPHQYFLIGLEAGQKYDVEVDDEELCEKKADAGGIVVVEAPGSRKAGVRLRKTGEPLASRQLPTKA